MAERDDTTQPQRNGDRRPRCLEARTRWVAALLAIVCVVAMTIPGSATAGADDVGDLQARADRIARQLLDLQGRIGEIGEKFNQSQVRRATLSAQTTELKRREAIARSQVAARRADAARYAMSAYVGLDQGDPLSFALEGRQWDLTRRTGYAAIRIGNREQVVDELGAAQQGLADLVAALQAADRSERAVVADLQRQQDEATKLIADQQKLQDSVQGELALAVARRQAQLAEAQAAAASGSAASLGSSAGSNGGAPSSSAVAPSGIVGPGGASPTSTGSTGTTVPVATAPGAPPTTRPAPPTTVAATVPPSITPTPPPVISPPPSSGGRGQTVANAAISQLGVRYSWGGGTASGPSMGFGPGAGVIGFDCSGLALYAWARVGVYLPHSAQMQYDMSAKVSLSQLQPGDLVFYGTSPYDISHVAVYVGGGQVVHAPNSLTVVQYGSVNLWGGYYGWIGAARPG